MMVKKKLEGSRGALRVVVALSACTTTPVPLVTEAFVVVVENRKLHHHHRHHGNIDHHRRLHLSQQGYNEEDGRSRTIGDVVKGLHGGKYLFQDAAATGGGMSFEGQQFAEMSYSSSANSEESQDYYEDEPLPNWALKLQQPISSERVNNYPQLALDETTGKATVEIQNDERSWEKFYAFVVPEEDLLSQQQKFFVVEPKVGLLAPRGGTNDFSDRATVQVQRTTGSNEVVAAARYFLVVGTEAEKWTHVLV